MDQIEQCIAEGRVNEGWSPAEWSKRLRQLAAACEKYHPDRASDLRRWADEVDRRHPPMAIEPPIVLPPPSPPKPALVRY